MAELPEGFDLEALLAPIPGDAPQGIDIREDFSATSPYNRLRDARSEARDAERGQDAGGDEARDATPLWRGVRELALKTLTESTKDLEVAAWLTEALVRSHGMAGLAAGAKLMHGLAEQYWDGLFPLPDDYGMETRVAPVTGLNGRDGNGSLIQPLYKIWLFNRPDGTPVAFYQYQQSEQLGTLDAERRQQRIDAGGVPLEILEREARAAGPRLFATLLADAREARGAWQNMATLLDEKAGADGPSTTAVRDLLTGIIEVATRYAPAEAVGGDEAAAGEAPGETSADGAPGGGGFGSLAASAARSATREDALRALGEIANFFRRTEPHSPLSYTLDEAVRRGRMTWPELLAEVVADTETRNGILTTLGIRPPAPPAEE
ncbi:MAG TPA: type VI secretion system protein TssA [Acetobacteraceae bacterium]|jgi:type VI secretion system protein ImpA|nr:type VI secretion system protein TssA [Acetobacteraceae bacterium]